MSTNINEFGLRASILFGTIQELNKQWQAGLDGEIEIPEDKDRYFADVIAYCCRELSKALINAGANDVFKSHLHEAESEIESMGMFFFTEYNPFTDFADREPDPIPIGGYLYVWRVYHSDNWKPDMISAKEYALPITTTEYQFLMIAEDDQERFDGYLIGTLTDEMPLLTTYWSARGWQIEAKGSMQKIAH